MSTPGLPRLDRREAIKWMLTAAASVAVLNSRMSATDAPKAAPAAGASPLAVGYGTDPDLLKDYKSGELWPLTLTEAQRRTAAALCDAIIPADERSPGASSVGVVDFIDEWISAPYPTQQADRPLVLTGLAWIDAEARRRFTMDFASLTTDQQNAICDDICYVLTAKPAFKDGALFFKRYRDLTAGGFYTTREGMKDLGYVGNVASATFDGPPRGVLEKLGLV